MLYAVHKQKNFLDLLVTGHTPYLLISLRLSVSLLYNLPLCLSTYFAVDVLSELSMVVSFIIMPSWRVNICLYSQLQNAVCFSLVASLFQ